MDVSIIIVNYNTKDLLFNCLNSIYEHVKNIEFEVIISDNGSKDGSEKMVRSNFPQCIFIENNANLGFGPANNIGLNQAKGKYILYLNSDTVLLNNAVKIFYDYWESNPNKNHIGALGAPLLDEDLQVIHSYGEFANYSINLKQLLKSNITNTIMTFEYIFKTSLNKLRPTHRQDVQEGPVQYITGADLFLRNDKYAYFDDYFFLYFEESDLQYKMKKANLDRLIIEGPRIQHLCGGSVGSDFNIKRKASFSRIQYEISRIKFMKRYYNSPIFVFLSKFLVTLMWINPFLFSNTKKYIKTIWKL